MTETIIEPTSEQQQQDLYNSGRMSRTGSQWIDVNKKFAICILSLADGVDQPGDYSALKTAIENVTGIQQIELLVDGQTPINIPSGTYLNLEIDGRLKLYNN